ncbi:YdeI/OmpD-associated family protein [Pedobacter sp. L105]|uniref:DUF1905 domain-containing protein n=1 Tax=Pedobacter sp. L105 TaxID=1641871 RepID=UPI00131E20FF|nr:YdeI/OmpD-associated family protein [Pedobacter sp. L105]
MIVFESEIERFERMGEKTGWTFVFVPAAIADQIKPATKKSYRIRGKMDAVEIAGLALTPMGEGNFIIALKGSLRKQLGKKKGDKLRLELEEDKDFKIAMPADLELCLMEEKHCLQNFLKMPLSHQHYYINWLNTAKTEPTRVKRIVKIIMAMDQQMDFAEMLKSNS